MAQGTAVPFTPAGNAAVTYKVMTCDSTGKFLPSAVTPFTDTPFLDTPTFNPNGGPFSNYTSTDITSISAEYLCVSTDGSTPDCVGGGTCSGGGHDQACGDHADSTHHEERDPGACARLPKHRLRRFGTWDEQCVHLDGRRGHGCAASRRPSNTTPIPSISITNGATQQATVCWSDTAAITFNSACAPLTGSPVCETLAANTAVSNVAALQNRATTFTLHVALLQTHVGQADYPYTYTFSPYAKTIDLDGDLTGTNEWGLDNTLQTHTGTASGQIGYLSWDTDWVYFGFQGLEADSTAGRYFNIYLRGPAGPYTTTQDNRLAPGIVFGDTSNGNMPQVSGGVNWHFFVPTDCSVAATTSKWDGANWVDGSATVPVTCAAGGQLGTNSSLIECKVGRTALAITGSATLSFSGTLTRERRQRRRVAVQGWLLQLRPGNLLSQHPHGPDAWRLAGIAP